jgi:hypothetical protein
MKALLSIATFTLAVGALILTGCSSDDTADTTDAGTTTTGGTSEDAGTSDGDDVGTTTGDEPDTKQPQIDVFVPPVGQDTKQPDVVQKDPPGNCAEGAVCLAACPNNDSSCWDGCAKDADQGIVDGLTAIRECFDKGEAGTLLLNAMAEGCYTEFHACFFAGESGAVEDDDALDCKAMDECVDGCSSAECVTECLKRGLPQAQSDYTVYNLCILDFCKNPDNAEPGEDCTAPSAETVKQAENTTCGKEFGHCFDF